ncbi:efflux RND transporter periplasmic adaptor subunit [Undibacterium jejuense]|uniref:Efflux RND transporter periplasmic adaptor subunit n=1 Tax=Undibacterium jejuense TaxID=1344949 RepID=A0A923KQA1_9BURK|nr:efflux RND transporter periplasmic adaptor subunit [Undibacterium jejuense]MBC3863668.1 efflux RND transporter periplasmic adaptor subunit [Undibacterium jejuense]
MTKRMFIMLGCVVLLIAGLAFGKYLQIKQLIANAPKPGAQTVSAIKAEVLEWQPQISAVGTVTAFRGVEISSEVTGLVREVSFKSGQNVKRGDLLIQLNADSDIAQLRALEAAAELSATVLKRDQAQLAAEGVSQAQVDADAADLKSKRAQVAQQTANVEKKSIRAPFNGRLGITTVNPGQYINTGDKLVTLQTIDPVYIDFFVPQKQISSLKIGQNLKISSDSFAGQEFAGQVSSINPKIDTASRNVQVQATLSNQKQLLLPGMFANVALDVGDKNKFITLPQTSIAYNPYGSTVFVVKDGDKKDDNGNAIKVAQQVFVTTGATRGDQVAVLTGLQAGQLVVTSGQLKLKNGTPVVIDNSVQPKNSPNPTPQEH